MYFWHVSKLVCSVSGRNTQYNMGTVTGYPTKSS